MLAKTYAFIKGMLEFRGDATTGYDDKVLLLWYDRGRDLAHALTLRYWDC